MLLRHLYEYEILYFSKECNIKNIIINILEIRKIMIEQLEKKKMIPLHLIPTIVDHLVGYKCECMDKRRKLWTFYTTNFILKIQEYRNRPGRSLLCTTFNSTFQEYNKYA